MSPLPQTWLLAAVLGVVLNAVLGSVATLLGAGPALSAFGLLTLAATALVATRWHRRAAPAASGTRRLLAVLPIPALFCLLSGAVSVGAGAGAVAVLAWTGSGAAAIAAGTWAGCLVRAPVPLGGYE